MTCSRVPRSWRNSWVVWVRSRPDHWHCVFATNDPIQAQENAAWRASENLVMPPGERPVMVREQCHRQGEQS